MVAARGGEPGGSGTVPGSAAGSRTGTWPGNRARARVAVGAGGSPVRLALLTYRTGCSSRTGRRGLQRAPNSRVHPSWVAGAGQSGGVWSWRSGASTVTRSSASSRRADSAARGASRSDLRTSSVVRGWWVHRATGRSAGRPLARLTACAVVAVMTKVRGAGSGSTTARPRDRHARTASTPSVRGAVIAESGAVGTAGPAGWSARSVSWSRREPRRRLLGSRPDADGERTRRTCRAGGRVRERKVPLHTRRVAHRVLRHALRETRN